MLNYAPVVHGSALRGEGLEEALDLVAEAARWRETRVPRRRLNDLFSRAQALRPLPMVRAAGGPHQAGRIKILYVQQATTEAPTFVFNMNRSVELRSNDLKWIENTIRSQWPFTGTPIRLVFKSMDRRKRRRDRDSGRTKRAKGYTKGAMSPEGHNK